MLDFLYNYWWIVVIAIAAIVGVGFLIYDFIKLPIANQIEKVKEWLLYAVAQAEKELGGGTGQLKLRYVYDLFIHTFPIFSKFISFNHFSNLVDTVLETFNHILDTNKQINTYVYSS